MNIDLSKYGTDELWMVTSGVMHVLPIDEDKKTESLAWEIISSIKNEIIGRG